MFKRIRSDHFKATSPRPNEYILSDFILQVGEFEKEHYYETGVIEQEAIPPEERTLMSKHLNVHRLLRANQQPDREAIDVESPAKAL